MTFLLCADKNDMELNKPCIKIPHDTNSFISTEHMYQNNICIHVMIEGKRGKFSENIENIIDHNNLQWRHDET